MSSEKQPAPDVACSQSRESAMVVLEQGPDDTPSVWCDPEIADLVSALNKAGIRTVASCSGHGHRPGNIALSDGRELVIARDFDEARKIDAMFSGINGEPPMVAPAAPVAQAEPVGEIVHWSNGGRTLKFVRMDFEAYPAGTKIYVAPPAIPAQPDASVLVEALKDLLPDLDEALEDLELFGLHSDQGYRKLKDWYRKMMAATKAVDAAIEAVGVRVK